ncbi:hypothetical protein ACIRP2_28240 [Streptomyces sp. NPDC101194]|uniref:hypothetical protein n=1 Tax=Streptomyces sp. NPDC101194 TaxID=3366127 RepID=UPI0038229530
MTETTAHGLSTRSVHAGERRDVEGAVHTPLHNHSTFAFDTTADLLDVVEGRRSGNLCTRYGRPSAPSLIRPSVGLEDSDGLIADLAQALDAA